ncbi:response regulator [Glaciibacter flavus]|uniref:response regulator n=1 Tax=Orlajensenia flava TaxID=2565934 RepID=UPI003B005EED
MSTAEPGRPIRVIVADDQPLIRSAIRIMIEAHDDLTLVAEASDGRELLAIADAHPADVVLMDIRMPNLDGIAATRQLLAAHAGVRVIVLTTYDIDEYVVAAIRAGASGFLLKDVSAGQLAASIRSVHAGDSVLAPHAVATLTSFARRTPDIPDAEELLAPFTPRERDILLALATGASNEVIGRRLFLTGNTVKTHIKAILAKLEVPDRIHVLIWAYENRLVGPGTGRRAIDTRSGVVGVLGQEPPTS